MSDAVELTALTTLRVSGAMSIYVPASDYDALAAHMKAILWQELSHTIKKWLDEHRDTNSDGYGGYVVQYTDVSTLFNEIAYAATIYRLEE